MGGLLYKDFIAVNRVGKVRLTGWITVYTLIFIFLRIVFPGTGELQGFMVTNEDGSIINVIDTFFIMAYTCFIIMSMSLVSVGKIMSNDEKNKIRSYLDAMPLGKNTYVASKYVFIGISAYAFMSLDYVWGITCAAFCREGRLQDVAATLNSFVFIFISIMLLIASIELPLYISLGKEKAMRAMVVFWTVIAIIVIGFLMFGDLTVVSGWDIMVLMDYIERHKNGVLIFQMSEPVIILGLFYISYLISCKLYCNKEDR